MCGCGSDNGDGNNAPVLEYIGISKDSMRQGSRGDSIVVRILFEDIDGDIEGIVDGVAPVNIFRVDTRDGSEDPASFPGFPDLSKGQKGQMDLTILTTCCLFEVEDPCTTGLDTVNVYPYEIYIVDAKGNRSNTITTDPIRLLCP